MKPILPILALFLLSSLALAQSDTSPAEPTTDWPWAPYGLKKTTNPAAIPAPQKDKSALDLHTLFITKYRRPQLQLIFLGDSILHAFQWSKAPQGGADAWTRYYTPLDAAAFAVPGDKTQNLLWRITAGGELIGLKPKVVVLLIGINNLKNSGPQNAPGPVADGITTIVNYLKTKLPDTKILLLAILPYKERDRVNKCNQLIAQLEDRKQIFFLDLSRTFLLPDGSIDKVKMPDGLHPSPWGYQLWAQTMQPYLNDLFITSGQSELWDKRIHGAPPIE